MNVKIVQHFKKFMNLIRFVFFQKIVNLEKNVRGFGKFHEFKKNHGFEKK